MEKECWEATGAGPLSTRWVDSKKGDGVRCRWVARDFNNKADKDRVDLFAAMPPLEAKKGLFSLAAPRLKGRRTRGGKRMKLLFIDVRKAHLNALCDQEVFVQLPEEAHAKKGYVGKLKRWLYGCRGASSAWESEYTEKLEGVGFKRGKASAAVFYNAERDLRLVVHGDDFTFLGYSEDIEWIRDSMAEWYDIKVRGVLGDEVGDDKEVTILNRSIRCDGSDLIYKADSKHAQVIMEELGVKEGDKALSMPCAKDGVDGPGILPWEEKRGLEEELEDKETTPFRKAAATGNYLGADRPDIQFAVNRICRGMAKPTVQGWIKLRRLARYLHEAPEMEI